ncbi:hypothetical protein BLL52_0881 [Rhodoferax antarcticus ANT.BR]|uniref:Uncharacterized protein n=1 Tax=Rhodoferax antarcticus ANT.BR TaxID=1111071 RepID=A0A1Q8YIG8_9BURK|nr:hypothetical protein BLL52_0881 [Rhodoferax antarcticus ANT.BR]
MNILPPAAPALVPGAATLAQEGLAAAIPHLVAKCVSATYLDLPKTKQLPDLGSLSSGVG